MILSMFHNSSRRSSLKRIWLRNWKSLIALCAASIILLINYVLWVMAMNQGLYESRAIRHPVKKFIAHSNELGDLKASCLTPDYKKNSVIIMVTSSPNAFDKRQAIRESWGSIPEQIKEIGATVTVRFVLGDTSSQSIQKKINLEARDHRDILQGAFKDSYNNLTIKSVYAMNWVFKNCEHKFMMKTDHDMWINTPNLVKYIKSLNSSVTNLITGYAFKNVAPFRNQFSRYYVSYEDYYENYYPNFISGTAYLISRYALSKLLKCLLSKNQLLHLEDVQITGICAKEAAIERMHHDQFHYPRLLQCGHQITHAITAHGYSPNEMKSMWDSININQNMFSSEFVYICNIFSKEITGLSIISVVVVILLFVRAFSYFAHKEYTYIYALFIHEIIALIFIIIILLIIFSKSLENIYPI